MTDTPWYTKNYKDLAKVKGRILPAIQTQVALNSKERNSTRDTEHLHPSELSKKDWCARAAWYKIRQYPAAEESLAFSRLNIFEEGHAIHAKWQKWIQQAGILGGTWECEACHERWEGVSPECCPVCSSDAFRYREVPVRNDAHRILGHADGEVVDAEGRALIEIKSVGLGTVRWDHPTLFKAYSSGELTLDGLWKNIKKPFASHVRQGHVYMYCTGHDSIVFIYEWKPTQEVKEFTVNYQEEIMQPILDNCKTVIYHLEEDTLPDTPDWAYDKNSSGCKFCPYKKECWK